MDIKYLSFSFCFCLTLRVVMAAAAEFWPRPMCTLCEVGKLGLLVWTLEGSSTSVESVTKAFV